MGILDELNKKDWSPVSKDLNKEDLIRLLKTPTKPTLLVLLKFWQVKKLCLHKWIYWRFGDSTKQRRVCKKCYKKQQNLDVLSTYNNWVKETKFN